MSDFDLIIVGGGAAGLMAAASAIRTGKNVLLLEKNNKLGVKILMSGGTRCNITHACQPKDIVEAFGAQGKFLYSALSTLPPEEVIHLIEEQGVPTKVETGGKIFPVSDRAIDVRDALVKLATDDQQPGHCTVKMNHACREITKRKDSFQVVSEGRCFNSNKVLVTTGGKSYPGCGTTGDGYQWAKELGHTIVPTVAALTPITNHKSWTHEIKGTSFEQVELTVTDQVSNSVLDRRKGAFFIDSLWIFWTSGTEYQQKHFFVES